MIEKDQQIDDKKLKEIKKIMKNHKQSWKTFKKYRQIIDFVLYRSNYCDTVESLASFILGTKQTMVPQSWTL